MATAGGTYFGNYYKGAKDKGATTDEAIQKATVFSAIEKTFDAKFLKGTSVVGKSKWEAVKTHMKNVLKNSFNEGLEEVGQGYAEQVYDNAVIEDKGLSLLSNIDTSSMGSDFINGMVISGILGGVNSVESIVRTDFSNTKSSEYMDVIAEGKKPDAELTQAVIEEIENVTSKPIDEFVKETEQSILGEAKTIAETDTEVQEALQEKQRDREQSQPIQTIQEEAKSVVTPSEQPQKPSRFITETMPESELITDEIAEQLPETTYQKISDQETWDVAEQKVDTLSIAESENAYYSSEGGAEKTALGMALIAKHYNEGNMERGNAISSHLSQTLSKRGQEIQIASMMKMMTPTGMTNFANNTIETGKKDIREAEPNKAKKVDKAQKELSQAKNANEIAKVLKKNKVNQSELADTIRKATQTKEKTPAEQLSKKVEGYLKQSKVSPEKTVTQEMIQTLYDVAKKALPKTKTKKAPSNKLAQIALSLSDNQTYVETFNEAKEMLKDKYKDDIEKTKVLSTLFEENAKPAFIQEYLEKVLKTEFKDLGVTKSDFLELTPAEQKQLQKKITDNVLQKADTTPEAEQRLKNMVSTKLKSLRQEMKNIATERALAPKPKVDKVQKSVEEKLQKLYNIGGFVCIFGLA